MAAPAAREVQQHGHSAMARRAPRTPLGSTASGLDPWITATVPWLAADSTHPYTPYTPLHLLHPVHPPIRYGVLYELMVSAHTLTLVHGDCHLDNIFFSG